MISWLKKIFQRRSKHQEGEAEEINESTLYKEMGFRDSMEIAKRSKPKKEPLVRKFKPDIDRNGPSLTKLSDEQFHEVLTAVRNGALTTPKNTPRKHRPSEAGSLGGAEVATQPIISASAPVAPTRKPKGASRPSNIEQILIETIEKSLSTSLAQVQGNSTESKKL